jgi:hypothetical protein
LKLNKTIRSAPEMAGANNVGNRVRALKRYTPILVFKVETSNVFRSEWTTYIKIRIMTNEDIQKWFLDKKKNSCLMVATRPNNKENTKAIRRGSYNFTNFKSEVRMLDSFKNT